MKISKSVLLDKKFIWHPFTQHKIAPNPIKIISGKMAKLKDENGKEYLGFNIFLVA